jgi:hypothetical protein
MQRYMNVNILVEISKTMWQSVLEVEKLVSCSHMEINR